MNISNSWKEFLNHFGKKFQKDLIEISQNNVSAKNPTKVSAQQYLMFEELPEKKPEPQTQLFENASFGQLLRGVSKVPKPKEDK